MRIRASLLQHETTMSIYWASLGGTQRMCALQLTSLNMTHPDTAHVYVRDGANISRMFARVNARPAKACVCLRAVTRSQARDGTQQ
jgi:hypothetical protein